MRVIHFVYTFIRVLLSVFIKIKILFKKFLIFVIWQNFMKRIGCNAHL